MKNNNNKSSINPNQGKGGTVMARFFATLMVCLMAAIPNLSYAQPALTAQVKASCDFCNSKYLVKSGAVYDKCVREHCLPKPVTATAKPAAKSVKPVKPAAVATPVTCPPSCAKGKACFDANCKPLCAADVLALIPQPKACPACPGIDLFWVYILLLAILAGTTLGILAILALLFQRLEERWEVCSVCNEKAVLRGHCHNCHGKAAKQPPPFPQGK
jgi:hypothetical protein